MSDVSNWIQPASPFNPTSRLRVNSLTLTLCEIVGDRNPRDTYPCTKLAQNLRLGCAQSPRHGVKHWIASTVKLSRALRLEPVAIITANKLQSGLLK